jgi:hypothetical protein
MAGQAPTPGQVDLAQASYERCRQSEAFLTDFYEAFLASDPTIPPLFARTDFDRQKRLLQHALGHLMSFARRPNPTCSSGSPRGWPQPQHPAGTVSDVRGLRSCAVRGDAFHRQIGEAWEAALGPGTRFMERFGR